MTADSPPRLRLQTDLNSMSPDGWCWILRHNGRALDEVADELGLQEGMEVVVIDSFDGPEYGDLEFDAILSLRGWPEKRTWMALPNDASFRRVTRTEKSDPASD